jgi:hypothetical protein
VREDTPIVVVQHGLTGGEWFLLPFVVTLTSLQGHMNHMSEQSCPVLVHLSRKEALGTVLSLSTSEAVSNGFTSIRCCVSSILPTGAGVPVTSPRLYSAGHTDDTRNALAFISQQFPDARLLGLGFSLGSNVLTRYLGEEGTETRLHSVCALACVRESGFFPNTRFANLRNSEAMEPPAQ